MTSEMTTHRIAAEETPSTAVINAIAETRGLDPLELDVCLYDHVDGSALDSLIDPDAGAGQVRITFEIPGCHVTVDSGGVITVTPVPDRDPSPTGVPS